LISVFHNLFLMWNSIIKECGIPELFGKKYGIP
jgi:hypothetical protein